MYIEINKYCCSDLWNFDGFEQIYSQDGQLNKFQLAGAKQINRICGCTKECICLYEKSCQKVYFLDKKNKSKNIIIPEDNISDIIYGQNRLYVLEYALNSIIVYAINSPHNPHIFMKSVLPLPETVRLSENSTINFYKYKDSEYLVIYADVFHILKLTPIENGQKYECVYNKSLDIHNVRAFTIDQTNNSILAIQKNNAIVEYDIKTGFMTNEYGDVEKYDKHEAMNHFDSRLINPVNLVVYRLCDYSGLFEANIKNNVKFQSDGTKHRLILVSDAGDNSIKKIVEYPKAIGFYNNIVRYINVLFGHNPALKDYIFLSTNGKTIANLYDFTLEYPGSIAIMPESGTVVIVDEKKPAIYTIDNGTKNPGKAVGKLYDKSYIDS